MKSTRKSTQFWLLLRIALFQLIGHGQETDPSDRFANQILRIKNAYALDTDYELTQEIIGLTGQCSDTELDFLSSDPDNRIAIPSKWKLAMRKLTLAKTENNDQALVATEFTSFIQGRIGCVVPDWWKAHLFSSSAAEHIVNRKSSNIEGSDFEAANWKCSVFSDTEISGTINGKAFSIEPPTELSISDFESPAISLLKLKHGSVLLAIAGRGKCSLICFDPASGIIHWKIISLPGSGLSLGTTGPLPPVQVELANTGSGSVAFFTFRVFGSELFLIDPEDGSIDLRFYGY